MEHTHICHPTCHPCTSRSTDHQDMEAELSHDLKIKVKERQEGPDRILTLTFFTVLVIVVANQSGTTLDTIFIITIRPTDIKELAWRTCTFVHSISLALQVLSAVLVVSTKVIVNIGAVGRTLQ